MQCREKPCRDGKCAMTTHFEIISRRGAKLGHGVLTSPLTGRSCSAVCLPCGTQLIKQYAGPVGLHWAEPNREQTTEAVADKQAPALPAMYSSVLQFAADQKLQAEDISSSLRHMIQTLVEGQQVLRDSHYLSQGVQDAADTYDMRLLTPTAEDTDALKDLLATRSKLAQALTVLKRLLKEHKRQQQTISSLQQQVMYLQQQQTAVTTTGGLLHGIAAVLAGASNHQLMNKQLELADEQLAAVLAAQREESSEGHAGQLMQQCTAQTEAETTASEVADVSQQEATAPVAAVSHTPETTQNVQTVKQTQGCDAHQEVQSQIKQQRSDWLRLQQSRLQQMESSISEALQQVQDTRLQLQQEGAWAFPTSQGVVDLSMPEAVQLYQKLMKMQLQDNMPLWSHGTRSIPDTEGSREHGRPPGLSAAGRAAADAFVEAYLHVKDRNMALHSIGLQLAAIQRQLVDLKAVLLLPGKQCEGAHSGLWNGGSRPAEYAGWNNAGSAHGSQTDKEDSSSANEPSTVPHISQGYPAAEVHAGSALIANGAHSKQHLQDGGNSDLIDVIIENEVQAADQVAISPVHPSSSEIQISVDPESAVVEDTVPGNELSDSLQLLQQMTNIIDSRDATIMGLQQQLTDLQHRNQAAAERGGHTYGNSLHKELQIKETAAMMHSTSDTSRRPDTASQEAAPADSATVVFIALPGGERQQLPSVQLAIRTEPVPQPAEVAQAAAVAANAAFTDSSSHADLLGSRLSMAMLMPLLGEVHRAQQAGEAVQAARHKVCAVLALIAGTEVAIMQRQRQALALQKHMWPVHSWKNLLVQIWQLHETEEILAAEFAQLQQLDKQQMQRAVDVYVQKHKNSVAEQQAHPLLDIQEQVQVSLLKPAAAEAESEQAGAAHLSDVRPQWRKWRKGNSTQVQQQQQQQQVAKLQLANLVGWPGDAVMSTTTTKLKYKVGELLMQLTVRQSDLLRLDRHVGRIAAVMMAGTGQELCLLHEQIEVQQQQVERSRRGVRQQLLELQENLL